MTSLRLDKLLFRPSWPSVRRVALAAALAGGACSDKPAKSLGLDVAFACESLRAEAAALHVDIHRDGCDGELVRSFDVVRGDTAKAGDALDPGTYGLVGQALDANGNELGTGCVVATLPADSAPRLVVSAPRCDEADAALPDAGADAGVDAAEAPDAQIADAAVDSGVDAGPPPVCPADCSDPDPCTDDSCENGVCVHAPFSGARECDGLACTAGDTCVAGTCTAGTPTDSLCTQPGELCKKATCAVGVGCQTGNVDDAANKPCSDGIDCTTDVCRQGLCRPTDNCPANQLCNTTLNRCVPTCSGPADCDDKNPCTDDVCNVTSCEHRANTGNACDDGSTCTTNDRCSAGTCGGSSTCDPSAVCVNSVCTCPAGTKLCGNTCVNLNTAVDNCGVCGRSCLATQTCQGGACRPAGSDAGSCTAARDSGHDYLFCTEKQAWNTARNKCASWGYGLAIIGSAGENAFVRSGIGAIDAWLGANDGNGANGSACRLNSTTPGEGHWYWASATDSSLVGAPICDVTASGVVTCVAIGGAYQNWASGQPDNNGCTCVFFCGLENADCGVLKADGTWDDALCGGTKAYICESP